MKTIKELINTLPFRVRQKALKNTSKDLLERKIKDNNFLIKAFAWSQSPEGHDYWSNINKKYCNENQQGNRSDAVS